MSCARRVRVGGGGDWPPRSGRPPSSSPQASCCCARRESTATRGRKTSGVRRRCSTPPLRSRRVPYPAAPHFSSAGVGDDVRAGRRPRLRRAGPARLARAPARDRQLHPDAHGHGRARALGYRSRREGARRLEHQVPAAASRIPFRRRDLPSAPGPGPRGGLLRTRRPDPGQSAGTAPGTPGGSRKREDRRAAAHVVAVRCRRGGRDPSDCRQPFLPGLDGTSRRSAGTSRRSPR